MAAAVQSVVPWANIAVHKSFGVASAAHFAPNTYKLAWPSWEMGALPVEGGVAVAFHREIAAAEDPEAKRRELEAMLSAGRSPFPMMEMGMCRSNDFIKTRQGKKIAPSYFNRLFDGVSGITHFQIVQPDLDTLTLNLKSKDAISSDLQQSIQQKIYQDMGPEMRFEIVQVDEIKRTKSGKHRFVISLVD